MKSSFIEFDHSQWRSQGWAWPRGARTVTHVNDVTGYLTLSVLIIICKLDVQHMYFLKQCLGWVTEEQRGQNWSNFLLKCRKCHTRDPRIQKLPGDRIPAPPRKLVLLTRFQPPLSKLTATDLCPPKTNGLATPAITVTTD